MLINRTLSAGMADTFNKNGEFFVLVSSLVRVRVRLYLSGALVIDTDMRQGMSLDGVRFDSVQIVSSVAQTVEYWAATTKLEYVAPAASSTQMLADRIFSVAGLQELLPEDTDRVTVQVECQSDIFIGGANAAVVDGSPLSMRRYKANEQFVLSSTGQINAWVSNEVARIFVSVESPLNIRGAVEAYGGSSIYSNSQLVTANIDYVDFYVPDDMANIPIDFEYICTPSVDGTYKPRMLFTVGDTNDESLLQHAIYTTSGGNAGITASGTTATRMFSAGWHRMFLVDGNLTLGVVSSLKVESLKSLTVGFSTGAEIQILQERA